MFFVPKFLMYAYTATNSDDEFANERFMAFVQCCELITFSCLLWAFRPRKEWPDYFSLGLGGLAAEQGRGR